MHIANLLGLLVSTGVLAAPPATRPRPAPTTQPPRRIGEEPAKEFPSLKDVYRAQTAPLDRELAGRIMKRQETPAGKPAAVVDLGIDLRVAQRWFITQAASAKPQSEQQIIASLRSLELGEAVAAFERDLKPDWVPGPNQAAAMSRLHKLTFELGELKDAQQLDDVARKVGTELTTISSATPIDPRSLPRMRPPRVRTLGDEAKKPTTREALRSVAQLEGEAMRVTVAASLHRQLLTIAKAAAAADEKEAGALHQALAEGVDLARGLSSTSAFSAEAKEQIETELAEGLALVSDPRTRTAGEDRVQALEEYRIVMNRIAHSMMPEDLRSALSPAFAYAQTHAAEGVNVLNLIEEFTQIVGRVDALPQQDNAVVSLRTATTEVARQFAAARQAMVAAANDLGGAGGVAGMEARLAEVRELADLYTTLATMQQTFEVLNAYHPRPFGMIEQHATRAATVASSATRTPLRAEGIKFLAGLTRLARLSEAVTQKSFSDIPSSVLEKYAGVSTAEFSAKVKLLMADLINSAAAGQEPDRRKIERLNAVDALVETLHGAAEFEQNLELLPSLQKWADWTLTVDQVRALVNPYQQLVSGAFSGFVSDAPDAVEKFVRQRGTFAPVMAFVARDARYADACTALPEDLEGDLARLMTPMHEQPFDTERYVSFAVNAWSALKETDPDAAQIAFDFAADRLRHDLAKPDPAAAKPLTPLKK